MSKHVSVKLTRRGYQCNTNDKQCGATICVALSYIPSGIIAKLTGSLSELRFK